jgi:hypothetical protein
MLRVRQSDEGMKKGLHLLGEYAKNNYSSINEVLSIADLYESER